MMDMEQDPPYPNRVNHDSFAEAGEDKANACLPQSRKHTIRLQGHRQMLQEVNSWVIELYE